MNKQILLITWIVFFSAVHFSFAEEDSGRDFTYVDSGVLGITEGVTEFLPISSTGHLILVNRLLGLSEVEEVLQQSIAAYLVVVQGGAILAVLFLYSRQFLSMFLGVLGKNREGFCLLRNLCIAFAPVVVIAPLLETYVDRHLFTIGVTCVALTVGAFLMLWAERWRKGRSLEGPDLHEISPKQALLIGLMQCFALCPGTSRSMVTIVGGYFAGFNPKRAAEFSFLLGLITLSAACGYKVIRVGPQMGEVLGLKPMLFGFLLATIFAIFAIRWLVACLTRYGLGPFAYYRLFLTGIVVLVIYC